MNKNFWRNKKVLITGHTGFKGSWLALWLNQLKAKVSGYALASATPLSLFELANVSSVMQSEIGDIGDFAHLLSFFHTQQPEIVIHLAAQSLVRYSYQHPQQTYMTNVLGTINVLEAARRTDSVKVLVNVTSDKCYQPSTTLKNESDSLGGHDPYSSSKACAELVTQAYRASYFVNQGIGVATARAGNVIGGGDWAVDRLIPDIIRAYMTGSTLKLRYPNAVRPWQFVLEPLRGYLLLAEKLAVEPTQFAEAWNFGPPSQDSKSVTDLITDIKKLWAKELVIDTLTENFAEVTYLGLDSSKAQAKLNWLPCLSWEDMLSETVSWYQAFQQGENMAVFTQNQIKRYESVF